jgi:ABC-type glycerol-3-phosphate transport system substrate-binding protein
MRVVDTLDYGADGDTMTDIFPSVRSKLGAGRVAILIAAAGTAMVACSSDSSDVDLGANGVGPGETQTEDDSLSTGVGDPNTTSGEGSSTTAPADHADTARCTPAAINTDAQAADESTLRVWHGFDGDVIGFFDEVVAEFEAEHPGIDLEVEKYEGGYTDGLVALAGLDPSERPDVFMGSNASVRLQYDSGLFVSPAECTMARFPTHSRTCSRSSSAPTPWTASWWRRRTT